MTEIALDAEAVAQGCGKLALFERAALERVIARGGRARLDEAGLDAAVVQRLERVLGWFGFERGSPRGGPLARVAIAPEARDLVASSLAGVPSLRQRPVARLEQGVRLDAAAYRARAKALGSERLLDELAARGGIALLAALPRDLRAQALERGALVGLGEVGRLDLREKGIDLDGPAAVLAPEVYRALVATPAATPTRLAGTLLGFEPALALARESELEETKQGALAARSRERLGRAYPRARLELTPEADELDTLLRDMLDQRLVERSGTALVPGTGVGAFRALEPREQAHALLRARVTGPLADLAAREVLALDASVPADFPVRMAALRLVDVLPPAPRGEGRGEEPALEEALARAFTALLPAAEALGLVTVERQQGVPFRIAPTALLAGLADSAVETPLVLSADGEAVVVPGPRAALAAILLGRIGTLVSAGEVLRYRVTRESAQAAQASGDDLDGTLQRLRALVRGEVPAGFERLLREAAAGSVRARARVLHVLEVPRVLAADRAARVLGPLVLDRITPTLLALTGPLTPAARRALAREGVFLEDM